MEIICFGLILALFAGFCIRHRPFQTLSLEQLALLGYCCYMLGDLFSPVVNRHQYPGVQWLFPVLLAVATLRKGQRVSLAALAMGLLLNIFHFPLLKMRNTTGEYLLLLVLVVLSLAHGETATPKPPPARVS